MGFLRKLFTKENPAQPIIANESPQATTSNTMPYTTTKAYRELEVVNRCINLIVDSASQIKFDIKKQHDFSPVAQSKGGIRAKALNVLLNYRPNPYMDYSSFWRLVVMDMLTEGWAFIHWDGYSLYHIPAKKMTVISDKKAYISHYIFDSNTQYDVNEIIFIRDNSVTTDSSAQITGQSRLLSALSSIQRKQDLQQFKDNFFNNGAIFSLVLETEAVLSKRMKKRAEEEISLDYNKRTGKSSVKILDGGMKAKSLTPTSTKDLDIKSDLETTDKNICMALGVPPILLDSGNNANIRPNVDLLFSMTILPLMKKVESVLELFFAYDIKLSTEGVRALMPDAKAEAEAVTAKVNNGLITPNEGREELRYEQLVDDNMNSIRIPANIAGSGTGVSGQEGGKPATSEGN